MQEDKLADWAINEDELLHAFLLILLVYVLQYVEALAFLLGLPAIQLCLNVG